MNANELTTFYIALYGAILSTIGTFLAVVLGIRELRKEKRQVSITLEYVSWTERFQLVIVNTGHRPITIIEVGIRLYDSENNLPLERVPTNAMFESFGKESPFPRMLGDGEYMTLPLSVSLNAFVRNKKLSLQISVYDAEGNEYTEYKTRYYDPKWGKYYNSGDIEIVSPKINE